ncbi:3-phosphoserine/phosphohydroxythreonine transaminase [Jeotgalibacillus proteolyticus]|uniref:Phosphoserine aminotransferase n=1 Tax=Jeotgalibacillus proteolyticus TaxID=2082395 RepID=A0A2S5GBK6_9BACL|nr:3-phosphoserine/phosphohydroxythreonine transaminase [Jeotgalibacillus proteolyticus]PPA70301.1 3-phosphoserine/phosphohydroxythreonine aminotransferase [Jeotgalibacillus proteolyticus]
MDRVVNFSAGPSALPLEVLQRAQSELINTHQSGMSVMEMSHRSKTFERILHEAKDRLKKLLNIPDSYKILFLQGGASLQFSMIPLNLLQKDHEAAYLITGSWSKKALAEAKKVGKTRILASSEEDAFRSIPSLTNASVSPATSYIHVTGNNTIEGTRITEVPKFGSVPVVTDLSSSILSEKINVEDYGLIYAGAQKNLGPSGVTLAIIREDLIGQADQEIPTMLDYATHAKANSLYNTPPTFGIYMVGLVLEWIESLGGIEEIEARNHKKASLLYEAIDSSPLFFSPVRERDRSLMNIPFKTENSETDAAFLQWADSQGLVELKGHRSVGGMRASIYNAMPYDGVERLVDAMTKFEQKTNATPGRGGLKL